MSRLKEVNFDVSVKDVLGVQMFESAADLNQNRPNNLLLYGLFFRVYLLGEII